MDNLNMPLPHDWDLLQLRRVTSMRSGESITSDAIEEAGDFPVYGGNGIRGFTQKHTHAGTYPLIGRQGAHCGNVHIANGRFWASEHAIVCNTKHDPRWLAHLLRSLNLNQHSVSAAQPGLAVDNIMPLPVPVPPLETQRRIAAFLDRKTAAIDALIAKKQRLITLLQEKRQALITQAVTKGLNPDVPKKDSGVPWIGEIPAHWNMAKLKNIVSESVAGPYGSSLTKSMYSTEGYRVYGQQQVIPNDFSVGDYFIDANKFTEMTRYRVFPGDVLISVMGTIGRCAVVPADVQPGIINPRLVRYSPDRRAVTPDYLRAVVINYLHQEYLSHQSQGTTMEGINMQIIGQLPIPLPDLQEQEAIANRVHVVEDECKKQFDLVSESHSKLTEYRQTLISAAVTGQIAISEEAA